MSFQKESKIIIKTFEWVPEPKEPSIDPRLQDVLLYWMKEYSDCLLAFQDISDAVCVHSINEAIVTIKKILENIPNTTNQPLMPQTKENGKGLKGK